MKYLRFIIFLIITGSAIASCNSEKKRMIEGLSGSYLIDTAGGDYKLLKKALPPNLLMVLSKDGSYHFFPQTAIMRGFDGQWDLSDNDDFAYYILKCKNGKYQMNRTMFITISVRDKDYMICFDKKVK